MAVGAQDTVQVLAIGARLLVNGVRITALRHRLTQSKYSASAGAIFGRCSSNGVVISASGNALAAPKYT